MQYKKSFLLLFFGFLTSCQAHRLSIQTQYISRESLASYNVGTPDANLDHPTIGQRLLIEWSLPTDYLCYQDLTLVLKVRFKNRKEEEKSFHIQEKRGTYLYYLVNEKFCETGGIATYKAEMKSDGCIIDTWSHPLWTDLITFQIPN